MSDLPPEAYEAEQEPPESEPPEDEAEGEAGKPAQRIPPRSDATEEAVLSAWQSNDRFALAWKPEPELFTSTSRRLIAEAMAACDPKHRDDTAVIAALERRGTLLAAGGPSAVFRVTQLAPAHTDPWPHVERLRELAALRKLLAALEAAVASGYGQSGLDGTLALVQDAMRTGSEWTGTEILSVADMFQAVFKRIQANEPRRKCPTGVPELDSDTGGIVAGFVAVVGATTSWGKTSFALMIADECMAAGLRPLMVSWEDDEELLGRRLLARRAKVHAMRLREQRLRDDEWNRLTDACGKAESRPFLINAIGKPVERVAADIRSVCASDGADIVLCDYLQAIPTQARKQDRRNEITHIARTLTDTIKTSGAAGVLFSQIKRLLKKGDRPTMHDLKESGDVENAAELVFAGYRNKQGAPMISVEKCKDGPAGKEYELAWDAATCSFLGQTNNRSNGHSRIDDSPEAHRERYP